MKFIKSLELKNSPFFKNNLKIKFSEKLNYIMSGRGTGKSRLRHFIKFALETESENDYRMCD